MLHPVCWDIGTRNTTSFTDREPPHFLLLWSLQPRKVAEEQFLCLDFKFGLRTLQYKNSCEWARRESHKTLTSTIHTLLEIPLLSVQLVYCLYLILPWDCHSPSSSHRRARWRPVTSRRRAPACSTRTGRAGEAVWERETGKYPLDALAQGLQVKTPFKGKDNCSGWCYFNWTTHSLTKCHLCHDEIKQQGKLGEIPLYHTMSNIQGTTMKILNIFRISSALLRFLSR